MTKIRIAVLLSILFETLFCLSAAAQNKKLTMEDAIIKARTTLAPKNLSQLNWVKNSGTYYYINNNETPAALYTGTASAKKDDKIITLDELNAKLKKLKYDTLGRFPMLDWKTDKRFVFQINKNEFEYDAARAAVYLNRTVSLNEGAEKNDVDTASGKIAYTVKNNLFVYTGSFNLQITNDENENIVNGSSVHRDEFGITKGTFFSPQGNKLAFYRMDQSMVSDYPVMDVSQQPAQIKNIKYPMAGAASHQVTVGVYDFKSQKKIFLQTGEPKDQYLTNISWSADEKHIYLQILNRDQNHMKLNRYNAETGTFEKTLFEERDEKYVEPLNPIAFVPNNPTQFIYQTNRDGYNHLYLYDTNGKLIRQLTKGMWEVISLVGFDKKGEKIIYTSTQESPLNRDMYSVSIDDGKIKRLTDNDGTHTCKYNFTTGEIIDNFSNTTTPRKISILSSGGRVEKELLNAENPLTEFSIASMKLFSIKNAKGDDLHCRMFYPNGMDSTKKYPVIFYLYNGPHIQLVTNSWQGGQGDLWLHYLAQEGFLVFTLDGRGSGNRGKQFEQALFRQMATVEMDDQLAGVAYLKTLRYVDANRLGVDGWSYGGFMTASLMTRHAGVFKTGVAGGPVIDWSYYEVMYTERYMDTPQTNPDGYKNNSLLNSIENLKGKLLLIHGTTDDTVVWQHTLMLLKKAVDKNVQLDYFVYPGHPHNVRGKDRVHLMNKITQYFKDNL